MYKIFEQSYAECTSETAIFEESIHTHSVTCWLSIEWACVYVKNTYLKYDTRNVSQHDPLTSMPYYTPYFLRVTHFSFERLEFRTAILYTDHRYCIYVKRARPITYDEDKSLTNSRLWCWAPRKNKYGYQRPRVSLQIEISLQLSYFVARRV
jgi:hypothetical protein